MLDDLESTPGDLVHDGNIIKWQQKFCDNTGHSMKCVDETVNDMAALLAKTCISFDIPEIGEIVEKMGVEQFDKHLRKILAVKDCNCNKSQ